MRQGQIKKHLTGQVTSLNCTSRLGIVVEEFLIRISHSTETELEWDWKLRFVGGNHLGTIVKVFKKWQKLSSDNAHEALEKDTDKVINLKQNLVPVPLMKAGTVL